jgi:hypothetical protein
MLHQLLGSSLTFNRAAMRHAVAHQLLEVGLVEMETLEQNECRVRITPAGRHLARRASYVLSVWSSERSGDAEPSTQALHLALRTAAASIERARAEIETLEAALALARTK